MRRTDVCVKPCGAQDVLERSAMVAYVIARAVFALHILAALSRMVPCADAASCPLPLVAATIAAVAVDEEQGAALIGLCAHETRCRVLRQLGGGPARSWWQIEPVGRGEARRLDAARLEADPLYAASQALAIWGRGNAGAYACGDERKCRDAAAELRRYVASARWAMRW